MASLQYLPRWIRDPAVRAGTVADLISEGWIRLHESASLVDASQGGGKRGSDSSKKFRTRRYDYSVFNLPAQWRKEHGISNTQRELNPKAFGRFLQWRLPVARNHRRLSRDAPSLFLADTHKALAGLKFAGRFDVANPIAVLASVRDVLTNYRDNIGLPRVAALLALAWIGLAVRGLGKMQYCEFCFRWAIPGYRHCYEHSQSREACGTSTEKAKRYKRAKRVGKSHAYRYPPRPRPKESEMSRGRIRQIVARVLCLYTAPAEASSLERIRRQLGRTPLVVAQLGLDSPSSDANLMARLTGGLDPQEIMPSSWPWKLKQAERWCHSEAEWLAGKWHRARRRVSFNAIRAGDYAREGYTKSQVASIVEVSRSTISKWLSRGKYPELKRAFDSQRRNRSWTPPQWPRRRPMKIRR